MELFHNLAIGFQVALSFQNIFYCLVGCLLGTLIGVLPGIGPVATIAMLLPATYALPPVAALIMLAGIYYGAQYGGSTRSEEHTSELQSQSNLVCRLLLEKKKKHKNNIPHDLNDLPKTRSGHGTL